MLLASSPDGRGHAFPGSGPDGARGSRRRRGDRDSVASSGDPGRRAGRRPGRSDPLPAGPRLARPRSRSRADDGRHHLRHRVAHQGARHHAGRAALCGARARSSSTRRSAGICKEFATPAFQDVTIRACSRTARGSPRSALDARRWRGASRRPRRSQARPASRPSGHRVPVQRHRLHPARRAGAPRERRAARPVSRSSTFYAPLGMRDTRSDPPAAWRARIAPTEVVNGHAAPRGGARRQRAAARRRGRPRRHVLDGRRSGALLPHAAGPAARSAGRRYLKEATVRAMCRAPRIGEGTRALGWDIVVALLAARSAPSSRRARSATPASPAPPIWIDPREPART